MTLSQIYRDAVTLEAEFGDDAHDIALERAQTCLDGADHDGHHHWAQVARALREMSHHPKDRRQ